jgi:hypothetical protein
MSRFRIGDLVTNGLSAGRVSEIMTGEDPRWRTPGVRLTSISLQEQISSRGISEFVPDHLLTGWHLVPFDWRPTGSGALEERYVWGPGRRWLQRETRTHAQPTTARPDTCPHCGGEL